MTGLDLVTVDHLLTTTRSVRKRLDLTRSVDRAIVERCIEIALQAPSGGNVQGWHFVVVADPEKRRSLAAIYRRAAAALVQTYSPEMFAPDDQRTPQLPRMLASGEHLTAHLHEVPLLVIPCIEGRFESAGVFIQASLYGSILPAVWSFMLALRARGLGAAWTTDHLMYEREAADILAIPDTVTQVALLPVAYFTGADFKPARRLPRERSYALGRMELALTTVPRRLGAGGYFLWPGLVILFTYAVYRAGHVPPQPDAALLLTTGGIALLLAALEVAMPARPDWGIVRDPQLRNDLVHGTIGAQLGTLLAESSLLIAATSLAAHASERFGGSLWPVGLPLPLQAVLVILIADGLEYWRHRAMHRVPWLWPFHALHHSTDRLHVLKAGRNHFVDMFVRTLCVFAPLVALGVPRDVLFWYPASIIVLGPLAHANVAFRFPAFMHRLLVTPPEHRVHHAAVRAHADRNFALILPLWDIVFGTFADPELMAVVRVGIEDDDMPTGVLAQVAAPFGRLGSVRPRVDTQR